MANYELLHLEQRFRLRVEHEQTGLPLPPRHELLPSQPPPRPTPIISADVLPSLFSLQQQQRQGSETPAVNANKNPWIQQNSTTLHPTLASLLPGLTGNIANVTLPGLNLNNAHTANISPSLSLSSVAQQLLLQQKSNERLVLMNRLFPLYSNRFCSLSQIIHLALIFTVIRTNKIESRPAFQHQQLRLRHNFRFSTMLSHPWLFQKHWLASILDWPNCSPIQPI